MSTEALNYPCTTFGPLKIPYYSLVEDPENPYKENEVEVIVLEGKFEIPDEKVRGLKEKIVKEKEKEAREKGKSFFDGAMASLRNYSFNDEDHEITLYEQLTSFFTRVATNNSLDEDVVWQMVEKRGTEYTNLDDGLANPIGNNVLVLTQDGYVILNKRSDKLAQYPGLYGILPAGFTVPVKEENGKIKEVDGFNQFNTARREAIEELGVKKLKNLELLGFGRAGDDRHVEFQFLAETEYTINEVLSAPKSSKYEAQEIIPVEFSPKELAPYLTKTIKDVPKGAVKRGDVWIPEKSPTWVPAQNKLVIDALIKEYGFEKVYKAIEDAFYSYAKPKI